MKKSFAPSVAILSVLAFLAWMLSTARDDRSAFVVEGPLAPSVPAPSTDVPLLQDQTGGSGVPCAVPLAWRIARVDESFELGREEAREAFERAATLWNDAMGPGLFSNEPDGSLAVRFVYDERQERSQERSRLVRDFNEASTALEARRVEFDERSQRIDGMRTLYQEARQNLDRRVTSVADSIRYWNAQGGAPEDVISELRESGKLLDAERATLIARGREIDGLQRRLTDDSVLFDREVEAHRREGETLEATFPVTRVQAGIYREAVHTQDGEVTSVTREIRIFRFDGLDDLVRVAAHELGHALGLGHSAVPGSLMREEFAETVLSEGSPSVQPSDVEALQALCPGL